MFQFVPEHCQSQILAVCDVEKLNVLNREIKNQLIQNGDIYIHVEILSTCLAPKRNVDIHAADVKWEPVDDISRGQGSIDRGEGPGSLELQGKVECG